MVLHTDRKTVCRYDDNTDTDNDTDNDTLHIHTPERCPVDEWILSDDDFDKLPLDSFTDNTIHVHILKHCPDENKWILSDDDFDRLPRDSFYMCVYGDSNDENKKNTITVGIHRKVDGRGGLL
ncbi:hypothetical protein AGMMS49990_06660 [Endomicrobiia bacterium]|nr:hypothetical protein AGMMS49990_06660 [Endomicrobiia bacterium]